MINFISSLGTFIIIILISSNSFAFRDTNNSFTITQPKGWTVQDKTYGSSETSVKFFAPNMSSVIAIRTFKTPDAKSKLVNGATDFANNVSLRSLRKTCPSAELVNADKFERDGANGVHCILMCKQYYFEFIYLFKGDDTYFIESTFDNQYSMDIVKRSVATFKILTPKLIQKK